MEAARTSAGSSVAQHTIPITNNVIMLEQKMIPESSPVGERPFAENRGDSPWEQSFTYIPGPLLDLKGPRPSHFPSFSIYAYKCLSLGLREYDPALHQLDFVGSDVALKMASQWPELGANGSALGLLARKTDAFRGTKPGPADPPIAYAEKPSQQRPKFSSRVLFVAAEVGNTEYLVEVIGQYPDLIWRTNDHGHTIFHVAARHRHMDIYNLVHEIGSMKDMITPLKDENGNNMLHLVGKCAKKNQYQNDSGVGLQMQSELLWFKVLVHLRDIWMSNFCV
ncbi:hypothetical protein L2E82_12202 [Cichorium intybus]|uniref:Uncharacterized protein n=1 Tax=Cichorium intybus TaxID=13427 RepID=A0ACB9GF96_CICIN|nr:hypothetical protein L2E82_12202 [Cichorium intybus]